MVTEHPYSHITYPKYFAKHLMSKVIVIPVFALDGLCDLGCHCMLLLLLLVVSLFLCLIFPLCKIIFLTIKRLDPFVLRYKSLTRYSKYVCMHVYLYVCMCVCVCMYSRFLFLGNIDQLLLYYHIESTMLTCLLWQFHTNRVL